MVRGSRAVGVSWDMGMAQGLRVGVWEGSEMVYCTTAASHLKRGIFGGLGEKAALYIGQNGLSERSGVGPSFPGSCLFGMGVALG